MTIAGYYDIAWPSIIHLDYKGCSWDCCCKNGYCGRLYKRVLTILALTGPIASTAVYMDNVVSFMITAQCHDKCCMASPITWGIYYLETMGVNQYYVIFYQRCAQLLTSRPARACNPHTLPASSVKIPDTSTVPAIILWAHMYLLAATPRQ